jgi:glycosyltransferase involved in cell wall biosynthesis
LIYIHDIIPNLPEVIRYKRKNPHVRMILDYHADYSNSGKNAISRKILHGILRKHFLDIARPHLSRIYPVVPASATFLHEVYGVPYSEMEVLPLGADMDLARRILAEGGREALRERYGFRRDDVIIFTGGKLTPNRRTEVLFEAMARLGRPNLRAVVVGDASDQSRDYRDWLHALAAGRDDIRFSGWLDREDIYRHMAMCDLAVFPASQSILWQQSIAMSLPLIVGDVGWQDISYLNLADNIVVLRKDEIRADPFAEAISSVVSDPMRLKQMAEGARSVAEEHLDWNKLILRTLRYNS